MNKLLFIGNERLATGLPTDTPILKSLLTNGYEISGVILAQSELGSSRKSREPEIVQVAEQHNIPVISPAKISEIEDDLKAMEADAAVLAAYGKIVPASIINVFPKGIINIHPSLLPKHRGPTPIESVILNGELETGVSLMQLAPKMDAGPVFAQQAIKLNGDETKQQLADQLGSLGAGMLIKNLPAILSGELRATPQVDNEATYDQLVEKTDGVLDFTKAAARLEREIRAYAGWPKSKTKLGGVEVIITRAHAVPTNNSGLKPGDIQSDKGKVLTIECGQGYLCIDALQPLNKKEMPVEAFLAGYKL